MFRVGARAAIVAAVLGATIAAPAARAQSPAPYGHERRRAGSATCCPPAKQGLATITDLAKFEAQGTIPPHFDDQLPMYENLVYAAPTLTDAQVPNFFKDATFGVQDQNVASVEHPEPGLTIVRDQYDVPHIYGETRAEVMFGTGYAGAEDRLFLMDVLRHTAEATARCVRRRLAVEPRDGRDAVGDRAVHPGGSPVADRPRAASCTAPRARSSSRTARTTSPGSTPTSSRPRTRSTPRPRCPPSTPRSARSRSRGSSPT